MNYRALKKNLQIIKEKPLNIINSIISQMIKALWALFVLVYHILGLTTEHIQLSSSKDWIEQQQDLQWLNLYKDARAENFQIAGSYDEPILLTMETWNQTCKYSLFRFEANRLLQESFMTLTWKKFMKGSYAYQYIRKLKSSKKK